MDKSWHGHPSCIYITENYAHLLCEHWSSESWWTQLSQNFP